MSNSNENTNETLWDDAEVSSRLGLKSPAHLRTMRARRQGPPFIRVAPRTVRYEPAAVKAWLAARTIKPADDEGDAAGR